MNLKKRLNNLAHWAKQTIGTLYCISKHPETPRLAKITALIALAYALSPIDLIPDFIPLLGYLDDLVILPLLVGLAIRLVPKSLLKACETEAREHPVRLKKQWGAAVIIILLWIGIIAIILKTIGVAAPR